MRGLPALAASASQRTRRWDAVVLGGALPGLIAAVRLGMRGERVLVLEEDAALAAFPGLREPFLMTGGDGDGVLAACLRALGVPLIDRRRLDPDACAYQIVTPGARIDVGDPVTTIEELVAWKVAAPETAHELVRALADAAAGEREAMLLAPVVRSTRRLPLGQRRPSAGPPRPDAIRHPRGLPAAVASAPGELAALFAAQVRALSNLGASAPSPEARARLLGLALESTALLAPGESGLRGLLRRRIESLHGEFRSVSGAFRLIAAAQQPGIELASSGEILVGRALVLNAPRDALARAIGEDPVPEPLRAPPATRRRLALHFRLREGALPAGMAPRVILVREMGRPMDATNVVTLRVFSPARPRDPVDLVASAVIPSEDEGCEAAEAEIAAAVSELLPFSQPSLQRVRRRAPRWDVEDLLSDPPPGGGWPGESEVRLACRQPVYALERCGVASLGFDGDLLLGWRAGDAIAADLA
ncbi:MAG: hypothetical protein ACHQ3O_07715 [Candidatus Limnocylindria bacterium]